MNKKLILIMAVGVCSVLHGAVSPWRKVDKYTRPGILGKNPEELEHGRRVKQAPPMCMLESEPSKNPFMCRHPEDRVLEAERAAFEAYGQMRKAQDTEHKALEQVALMEDELQQALDVLGLIYAENVGLRRRAAQFEDEHARWEAHIQQMKEKNARLEEQVLQGKIEKAEESLERINGDLRQAQRERKLGTVKKLAMRKQDDENLIKNLQYKLKNCLKAHDIM